MFPGFTVKKFCDFSKNSLCGFQEKLKQDSELNWHHMPTTSSTAVFKREKKQKQTCHYILFKICFRSFKERCENQVWPEVRGNRHGDRLVFILPLVVLVFFFLFVCFFFFLRVWEQGGVAGIEWAWLNGIWGWMGKWLHRIKSGTPLA